MSSGTVEAMKRRIAWSADVLGLVERYTAAILTIVMTALYALNVLIRLFLPMYASTFAWIDEAARYLMIWVVFLAAGLTLEVGRHVSVDIAHALLSPRIVRILFAIIDIVGFVFSVGAAFYSLQLALFVAGTGQISPTLGVPTYILYVAPFVGFTSLAFRFLLRLANVRDARRSPVWAEWLRSAQS
jgi:TRAP-type C4-dicarboxylate transport system permease small subunit